MGLRETANPNKAPERIGPLTKKRIPSIITPVMSGEILPTETPDTNGGQDNTNSQANISRRQEKPAPQKIAQKIDIPPMTTLAVRNSILKTRSGTMRVSDAPTIARLGGYTYLSTTYGDFPHRTASMAST